MKWFKKDNKVKKTVAKLLRSYNWKPKIYILKKDLPNMKKGSKFQQSYLSDSIYFCAIPVSSKKPEKDQVGIMEFEAKDIENNFKWFFEEVE